MVDLNALITEVTELLEDIDIGEDGEHLWSNYQRVTATAMRLQAIHNEIALEEIHGRADMPLKKFRTMVVDPSIERLHEAATFESRKITAKNLEATLER